MSILIILTVILLLIGIYYVNISSLREERGFFLRMIFSAAFIVFLNQFIFLFFIGTDQQFLNSALALSIASLSSLYLRNILFEQRTSIYLLLLAFFPFILFYVYYFLFVSFSEKLLYGEVYHMLDFFYQNFQSILLAGSIAYDFFMLRIARKDLPEIVKSVDAKLGLLMVLLKVLILGLAVASGLTSHFGMMFKFPLGIFIMLNIMIIFYFRYGKRLKMLFMQVKHAQYIRLYLAEREALEQEEKERFYLEKLEQIIEKDQNFLRTDFGMNDLVRITKLNKKEIQQIFKSNFECSFSDYLKRRRIRYCLAHLRHYLEEGQSIHSLALDLGFKNLSSFVQAFKKEVGRSPYIHLREKREQFLSLKGH